MEEHIVKIKTEGENYCSSKCQWHGYYHCQLFGVPLDPPYRCYLCKIACEPFREGKRDDDGGQ